MQPKDILSLKYIYQRRSKIIPIVCHRFRYILNLMNIAFDENDRQILKLKNIHRNRRAFIIGMGPSLSVEDLDRLKNEITFACNKVFLSFDQTSWRPSYYSVTDVLVAEYNREIIYKLPLKKIFDIRVREHFPEALDIIWLKPKPPQIFASVNNYPCFSSNIMAKIYGGYTVIFTQLQLAYYMGIREIYLLGVDFSFNVPKVSEKVINKYGEVVLESKGEVNHFHPGYRKRGEKWTFPRLDAQYHAFSCAKEYVEKHGGIIYNASRKTALNVFPLIDFDSLWKS